MIYLTQLIYVREGEEPTFHEFEESVLGLLPKYRGELVLRLRPDPRSKIDGSAEAPYEVHIVSFESDEDFARYSNDEQRKRMLPYKDKSVRNALLFKGAREGV
jgi:hypothetical protein